MRRDGPVKFEKDFDFESANAQFNKEEIDREFHSKLKLKGTRGPGPRLTQWAKGCRVWNRRALYGFWDNTLLIVAIQVHCM